jgi:hypothetical protein
MPGQRSREQLSAITAVFIEHYEMTSREVFAVAGRLVEKQCDFFPTVKNIDKAISDAVAVVGRKRDLEQKALPEETGGITEDEIAQNQKRIDIIIRQLSGELSLEEAMEQQQQLTTWAQTNETPPENAKTDRRHNDKVVTGRGGCFSVRNQNMRP